MRLLSPTVPTFHIKVTNAHVASQDLWIKEADIKKSNSVTSLDLKRR